MTTWNQLPPVVSEGDPGHIGHHNLLRAAALQLQTEVDDNDAAITALATSKASVTYVDSEDAALEARLGALEGYIVPTPHVGPTPPLNPVVGQLWIQKAV